MRRNIDTENVAALQKNMRREDAYLVRVDPEVSGMEKYICGRKEQDENGFKEKPPSKQK